MFNCSCLDPMLIGMFKILKKMFNEAFWKQTVMVFTRLAMKSSTIHCQPALIENKVVCNTCCSVKFNSLRFDGNLTGMNNIFEEMFGEVFWKQVVSVFTRPAIKSFAIHYQLALIVNKTICNTCCPVRFNSLRMDGKLTGLNNISEEKFGKAFWKQTVMVFASLSMKSYSTHCQLSLNVN